MALTGAVTMITVTGRFVDLSDAAVVGQVTFTPSTPSALVSATGDVIISNRAITVQTDGTGTFVVALPATDDPNINPSGWTYSVTEPTGRMYAITVPRTTAGGILDLVTVAPASSANAGVVQAVAGRGITQGIVSPQGHLILTFSDGTTQDAGTVVTGGIDLTNYYTKTQADAAISASASTLSSQITSATANLVNTSDSRLADARTPTAHAASHRSGGTDALALDQLGPPSSAVAVNGQRLTGLADPTNAQDAATRAFVLANAGSGGGGGGGLGSIQTASDYDNTNAATDGQAILWSGTSSKFTPGSVVGASDSRLSNARTPTSHAASHGSAGSDPVSPSAIGAAATSHTHAAGDTTSGTFALARIPTGTTSSTVALGAHSHSGADVTSGTVAYARLPVGTTAGSSVADGGDSRFTNARTPLAHASTHASAGSDPITPASIGASAPGHTHSGGDVTSGTVAYARLPVGTAASTVAAGNDSRLSDARTPTGHASSHSPSGSDPVMGSAASVQASSTAGATNTTTTYAAIANTGVTFVAPPSGNVQVEASCAIVSSATNSGALAAPVVLSGGTIGSGTSVLAAADANAVSNYTASTIDASRSTLVTGLTPGSTYNAQLYMRTGGSGTATTARQRILVIPLAA